MIIDPRQTTTGMRLYAIDENGDGWRIVVERAVDPTDSDDHALVQVMCDTADDDERPTWRPALLHPGHAGAVLVWMEYDRHDDEGREHTLGLVVLIEGWSS